MTTIAHHRRYGYHPYRRTRFLRSLFLVPAAIIIVLACSVIPDPSHAAAPSPERVLVTDVVDGDTIKVLRGRSQETVRLIGVDTPETGRPGMPVQFWGPEASLYTRRALLEKRVRLEFESPERPGGSIDKYGRVLAYVFTDDGRNFNLELVEKGFGKVYARYSFRYENAFRQAEQKARAAKNGLWNETARAAWSDPRQRGSIIGNIRTSIYHVPGQRYYDAVEEKNRIYFRSEEEARTAGFRRAKN